MRVNHQLRCCLYLIPGGVHHFKAACLYHCHALQAPWVLYSLVLTGRLQGTLIARRGCSSAWLLTGITVFFCILEMHTHASFVSDVQRFCYKGHSCSALLDQSASVVSSAATVKLQQFFRAGLLWIYLCTPALVSTELLQVCCE